MGRRIITFDDLSGEADDTVAVREFSVGKTGWQIDLTEDNYVALIETLRPFIEKAKKVRGSGIKIVPPAAPGDDDDADPGTAAPSALRFVDTEEPSRLAAWAAANGVRIARPGRPPRSVLAAFRADDVSKVPDAYRLASA